MHFYVCNMKNANKPKPNLIPCDTMALYPPTKARGRISNTPALFFSGRGHTFRTRDRLVYLTDILCFY